MLDEPAERAAIESPDDPRDALSATQQVQAQLDAVWPTSEQSVTLAMLEVELKVDPETEQVKAMRLGYGLSKAPEPVKLMIQIELRALPDQSSDYRARVKVGDDPWQEWQPAEPAIGAQALLDL